MGKIAELLLDKLAFVYCKTCAYKATEEYCDNCNRKSMYWGISEEYALKLEEQIRNEVAVLIGQKVDWEGE